MGLDCELVRVVKVGGSLFNFAGIQNALRDWLTLQPPAVNVLIAGGGKKVDEVRQLQRTTGMDNRAAHWLAIEQLDSNARLLKTWLPEFELMNDPACVSDSTHPSSHHIFVPYRWLSRHSRLPESWDTTSDSIAAEIARAFQKKSRQTELVLLKSCLPEWAPHTSSFSGNSIELADVVDRGFNEASRGLNGIRIVNLRNKDFESVLIQGGES